MAERVDADVCVVGAGYAGLTAARRLHQGGKTVVVLEARDRVGGRIWTEPLADGTPVDRGGAWLGPKHDAIFGLARRGRRRRPTRRGWRARTSSSTASASAATPASSRRSARSRSASIALRAGHASTGWRSRSRSTRRGPRSAPTEWDARIGRLVARAASGIRTEHRPRPLRDGGARPVHRRPERRVVPPPAVPRARARQHQHAVLDREGRAGEHGRRRRGLDRAARRRRARRRGAPERAGAVDHPARRPRRRRGRRDSSSTARHAVVTVPPALALEIAFDPVLPDDRRDALPQRRRRPGDEDARRLRRAVLARRRLQRADVGARIGGRGDARRVAGVGHAGRHRVVHVRAGRRAARRARSGRATPGACSTRSTRAARAACRVTGRLHRDRVVERGVDARLLDGAPPARASSRATGRLLREPFGRVHWAGTETATTSHGAIDGAVRSGERAAAEILDRT